MELCAAGKKLQILSSGGKRFTLANTEHLNKTTASDLLF